MSGSGGASRSRGENRFYNPPAVRQRQLEQRQRQEQEQQLRTQKQHRRPSEASKAASCSSVESDKRTESDDCASSFSLVSARGGLSSDATNLDRFLEYTTPVVPVQCFPKVFKYLKFKEFFKGIFANFDVWSSAGVCLVAGKVLG